LRIENSISEPNTGDPDTYKAIVVTETLGFKTRMPVNV